MSATILSPRLLRFRAAEKADIPAFRGMAERTWRKSYAAILSPSQMDFMIERMYAPEVIAKEIEQGVIWELASDEDGTIGFHSCVFDPAEQSVKLSKLYVLPEKQGQGRGQALLERVRDVAVSFGARKIWLQVNKNNAAAIRAYERAGYHIERAAVFDIGSGFVMDDFIMALALPLSETLSPKETVLAGT